MNQPEPICANCGIQIPWQPTLVDGKAYCCPGCADGGPCKCDYDNLPRRGETKALVCQEERASAGEVG